MIEPDNVIFVPFKYKYLTKFKPFIDPVATIEGPFNARAVKFDNGVMITENVASVLWIFKEVIAVEESEPLIEALSSKICVNTKLVHPVMFAENVELFWMLMDNIPVAFVQLPVIVGVP